MRIATHLTRTVSRLWRTPFRSLLLLQGTIWGVAVAIFPTAVIEGTRAAALERGSEYGADRIAITPDRTADRQATLTTGDLPAVREALTTSGITLRAAGFTSEGRSLAAPDGGDDLTLLQITPGALAARGFEVERGTDRLDVGQCIVEADVARALGRRGSLLGESLEIFDDVGALEVVGVTAPRSAVQLRTSELGFDLEHEMYASVARPFLFAMGLPVLSDDDWKRSERCVYVLAPEGAGHDWLHLRVGTRKVSEAATATREAFVARGKSILTLYPLSLPIVLGEEVDRFATVDLAMFLACLVMGAVVMANLGLLNVLSRAREIAIHRCEGATRADIALSFLSEGFVLGAVGSALGVALGMGLAALRASLEPVSGFTWQLPVERTIVAVGVALVIGLLAATLPAIRAARHDPVQGLADE